MAGTSPCGTRQKLSSFWLVGLLVDDTLTIEFRAGGQLPLVISFEAVILFVVSGTGFIPSNFNAETSDASIREDRTDNHHISDDSLLERLLTEAFDFPRFLVQFKELVDLSSLELITPFLGGRIPLEVSHYHHTFVELCGLGLSHHN